MALTPPLLLIAVGAILRYAVTANLSWIDVQTVGEILLIVGIIGFVTALIWMLGWLNWGRRDYPDDDVRTRRYPSPRV